MQIEMDTQKTHTSYYVVYPRVGISFLMQILLHVV